MLSSHTVGFQWPDNSNLANLTPGLCRSSWSWLRTQTMRRNKREGPRKRDTISILVTGTADTLEIMVSPEPSRDIFVSRLHSDINSNNLKNDLK